MARISYKFLVLTATARFVTPFLSSKSPCRNTVVKHFSVVGMTRPEWTACPRCHGEGKERKPPSRKARLRYKRLKGENGKAPERFEPCPDCAQTGLIQAISPVEPNHELPFVAIIGGGLGGLALGLACKHRQIPFRIFERDTSFSQRSQGYGLTMQQASRALASFGIPSLSEGITSTRHVVHTSDGTSVGEWGLRKWGRGDKTRPPKRQNVHVARQSLRRDLLQALQHEEGQYIDWGHKMLNMKTNSDGSLSLEFEDATRKGEHIIFSKPNMVVVGADGIRSTVRGYISGANAMKLRYLDCVVVLGICPLDTLEKESLKSELLDGETVFQTADGSTRIYMMPFSSTEYMWQLSFPMENEADAKSLSKRGPQALKEEALRLCHSWHAPIPDILSKTPTELISGYPVYDRELITLECLKSEFPVTLIGDAAHPMSPFKGQGANQALLDALSLARSFSANFRSDGSINDALDSYHEEMTARSAVKVKASARAVEVLHSEAAITEGDCTRGAVSSAAAPPQHDV